MTFASLINPYVKFPRIKKLAHRVFYLSPQLIEIMNDMASWAESHKLPFVVTATVSTCEEDGCLSRVSATHRTGRAFDLSIHGWLSLAIQEFCTTFDAKYLHVAATGAVSGKQELVIHHNNGNGDHLHVQVANIFGVDDPLTRVQLLNDFFVIKSFLLPRLFILIFYDISSTIRLM